MFMPFLVATAFAKALLFRSRMPWRKYLGRNTLLQFSCLRRATLKRRSEGKHREFTN
jgi:hypothetical protein